MTSDTNRVNYCIEKPDSVRADVLQTIEYAYQGKPIQITIEQPEYTSVCPMTGLPDYGTIAVTYTPDEKIVELKSFKFYLLQYRNVGIFYEHLVNRILDDLVQILHPKQIQVTGSFTARGGVTTRVTAVYESE